MAASSPFTDVNGAVGWISRFVGGSWVTTKTCSPAAGSPPQPFVMSNTRRPMTTAAWTETSGTGLQRRRPVILQPDPP